MAEDPDTPTHLKLGALKQLVALATAGAPASTATAVVMPRRDDGLPLDPLLEEFPPTVDDGGHIVAADPMADLDWEGVVGRPPHALYARVLFACPFHPSDLRERYRSTKAMHAGDEAGTLRAAEARFLREARNRGFDTEADEVADARRRRRRSPRGDA